MKQMRGLDDYTVFSLCIQYMNDVHRWSFKTFIHKMVTAQPMKPGNGQNAQTRAKQLNEALQQRGVRDKIYLDTSSAFSIEIELLATYLQTEIETVAEHSLFQEFHVESPSDILQLQHTGDLIKANAPRLTEFLYHLMDRHIPSSHASQTEKIGPLIMMYSIMAFAGAPQNFNNFATMFGLHTYSVGAKRRFINMMNFFGLCLSYSTIIRRHKAISEAGRVILLFHDLATL